jgi:DNA-binding transcriptional LysR family regulator
MALHELEPMYLSTFLAVLEAGRVSAAAKTLRLSQPAVTAQVRRLEEALGVGLFVRSVHGVAPTEAGLRFATHARSIRRLIGDAVLAVSESEEAAGDLVVGASTTIAAHTLPALLAEFRAQHRATALHVHVGNTEQVVNDVRAGRVPLGLVEGHPRASGVRLEPFLDDEIVPVMGKDAPFRVRRPKDLETVPLLWREAGSGTRAVVERALTRAGVRRRGIRKLDVELGSTEAILGGAVAGLGIAFVSRISIRAHLAGGLLRLVPGLDLVVRRTFHWAMPGGALSGPAASFYAFARRSVLP